MRGLSPVLVLALGALSLGAVQAHAALTRVTPPPGSVGPSPKTATLQFSEPLNTRFSTFRVMRVPAGTKPEQAAATALGLKGDAAVLASTAATLPATAALIQLPLKSALPKGLYVIAWKILSDDSHPVTDFRTFTVR